jgi:tRNA dimethylallyltransferase
MNAYNCIVIVGPTASGKTRLAANLAHTMQGEVISVDSRQVYKHMNIGTGKDYEEYIIEGQNIPVHLIDIREAGDRYHVHDFKYDFFEAFQHIQNQRKMPVICGGTGLYLTSVLSGLAYTGIPVNDELRRTLQDKSIQELRALFSTIPLTEFTPKADTSTAKRLIRAIEISTYLVKHTFKPDTFPELRPVVFGLHSTLIDRRNKIAERLNQRLHEGLIEEVHMLRQKLSDEQLEYYGLEYKYVTYYLQGKFSYDLLKEQLTTAIQQFAKRQMTYFRKMEREGLMIHWIDAALPVKWQMEQIQQQLDSCHQFTTR